MSKSRVAFQNRIAIGRIFRYNGVSAEAGRLQSALLLLQGSHPMIGDFDVQCDELSSQEPPDREAVMAGAMRPHFLIEGGLKIPSEWAMNHTMIAYKFCDTDGRVVCPRCGLRYDLVGEGSIALYPINFGIYRQSCHDCGTVIAEGTCESTLYPKPCS